MQTIGIIGSGQVGSNVAQLAVTKGHHVVVANSRGPESLEGLVHELGSLAHAATVADAVRDSDIVVFATPLTAIDAVSAVRFGGRIVIDASNYLASRDGHIAELDDERTTSSELLQTRLDGSRVVKALNHIHAPQLNTDARPAGAGDRRALTVFGDDEAARAEVAELFDTWGFDPLVGGDLAEGWRIQRGTPGWDARDTRGELEEHLAEAKRYRDMLL